MSQKKKFLKKITVRLVKRFNFKWGEKRSHIFESISCFQNQCTQFTFGFETVLDYGLNISQSFVFKMLVKLLAKFKIEFQTPKISSLLRLHFE